MDSPEFYANYSDEEEVESEPKRAKLSYDDLFRKAAEHLNEQHKLEFLELLEGLFVENELTKILYQLRYSSG